MDSVVDRPIVAARTARAAVRRSLDALAGNALGGALAEAEAALLAEPGSVLACHALGLAALRLGRLATAIDLFERAHFGDPKTREHAEALAITFAAVGRLVDSLYYGKLATALTPSAEFADLLPAWVGTFADHFRAIGDAPLIARGCALLGAGRARAAAILFQQEIALDRHSPAAWRGLAEASLASDHAADAAVASRALCEVEPGNAGNLAVLGRALTACGQHAEALACHRQACQMSSDPACHAGLIAALVADPQMPRAAIAAGIAEHARTGGPAQRGAVTVAPPIGGRKLRVGFVSARLRGSAGLDLFLPVIEQRDRADWHAFLYIGGVSADAQGRRLRNAAAAVTEIGEIDDETASLLIANDALDVLIDLDLHEPTWRGGIAAAHPAPAMIGWLGLSETLETLGYDAMLGDRWTQGSEDQNSILVPGGVFCLPADMTPTSARAGHDGAPRFATTAARRQITGQAVAIWAELLAALPESALLLDPARLGGAAAAAELRALFTAHGVEGQVGLAAAQPGDDGAIRGDVVLDAPGAGCSPETAVAALRAGLPVVTLPGSIPARREVASLLGAVGLDALIAADAGDYLAIARSFAAPAAREAVAFHIARCLDRPPALEPAARAAALGAALRRFVATRGSRP